MDLLGLRNLTILEKCIEKVNNNHHTNYDLEKKQLFRFYTKEVFDINDPESYEKCIIEYISGMTDPVAISIFEEISNF